MAAAYQPLPALHPPQIESPGDELGKMIQMKSMLQSQQMQQGQLQLQQQQIKDQQAMTAAMKTWDGKDYDALSKSVLQNGGSANAATQIQQHGLTIKKTVSDIAKQDAEAGSKNLDTFIGKQKAIGDALQGIESVPDEQLHDMAVQKVQSLMQGGILDPQTGQKALQGIQSTQDPKALRDQIDIFAKASMGAKAAAEQQKTQAETKKDTAQAGEAEAATGKTQLETQLMQQYGTPAQQEAKYISLVARQKQGFPLLPAEKAFIGAVEKYKAIAPTATFNLQNAGAAGTGGQPSEMAKAIANGSMKWQDVISPRTPMAVKDQLLREVRQLNPNFNSGDFQIEQDVKKDFTSGAAAKNLTAFNTAIEHAQQAQQAAEALDNGDVRGLNKIGNALGYQFGSDKTTNFNVIKNALSGEISKVFKGGEATDAEIKAVQAPFDAANSPAQLKGAIQQAISLMNSKRDALKQQYQSGLQAKPNFGNQPSQSETKTYQGHPYAKQTDGSWKLQQ